MRKRSVVIFSFILQTCLLYSIEIPNILINKSLDNSLLISHRQLNIHNYRGKKLNEIQCSGKILIKDNDYSFLWYVVYNENISTDEIINMSAIRNGAYFVDTPLFSDEYLPYLQAPDKYVYENKKMEFIYSYTPYGPYVRDVYIFIHYPVDSNIVRSTFVIENPLPFDNCDENSITREDLLLNPNTEEVFTIIEKFMNSFIFTNNKLLTDNKYLLVDLSDVGPGYDQEDLSVYNSTRSDRRLLWKLGIEEIVRYIEGDGNYYYIENHDGKKGWVSKKYLIPINDN